jgi:ketosteroid isomerase-like protein
MSRENVEAVRSVYEAWARGKMRAGAELLHPKVVFESFMPDMQERYVAHGLNGVEVFMREFLAAWSDYRIFADEIRQVDEETIFVTGRQTCIGKQSGASVEAPAFSIWNFDDEGRVTRLVWETNREDALKAAGLSD